MEKLTLTPSFRDFFSLVADATFTNPFSTHRAEIDRRIAGMLSETDWRKVVPRAVDQIRRRLIQLDKDGTLRVQNFDPADRALMTYVYLFDTFHRFARDFDDFIVLQQRRGDEPPEVPFADAALESLSRRGFSSTESARFFALFYQIRRAFFFIDTGLVGPSDCMRKLRMDLWNNIFTQDIRHYERYLWDRMEDFSTLLEGPTGSGKGAAAAAIGKSGFIPYDPQRKRFAVSFTRTFVAINLSQYPEGLIESELFGHTKGAFTGAVSAHDGLLSLCGRYGSIFLDEIGEIDIPIQVKLLKVLEERTFSPVGSHEKKRFGGRVIAATNRPINALRKEGKFRDDFYYRLCSDCIVVPSLAERIQQNPDELSHLVGHFVQTILGRDIPELTGRVLEVIEKRLGQGYHWPGNVRELAQCIRRVLLKEDYEGDRLEQADGLDALYQKMQIGSASAENVLSAYLKHLYTLHGTYEATARAAGLDRRTVKKKITES
jgi:transcriptional regulator with AAA-type ATPase domain